MEAFILGSGGMMPLPNRHLTSMLLRREGSLFLFDCGEGTQVSLRRLNLRWKKISAIFISHMHADHVTGLPGILMLSSQVDRDDPLYIFGPPKIKAYIESSRSTLDMYINYEIIVVEIDPFISQTILTTDEFSIRSFPLKHTKPCVGYVFEETPRPGEFFPDKAVAAGVPRGPLWASLQHGEDVLVGEKIVRADDIVGKERPGRKVSFVTDTLYTPTIAAEVADSDLLICEGMFERALEESAREKKHMTAEQAGMIGRDAGVRAMGLIHFSPRYTDRELTPLQEEAQAFYPGAFLCRDRMAITVPNRD